jgi:hypothetical protein
MTHDFSFYSILGGQAGIQSIIDTVDSKYNNTAWKSHHSWGTQQTDTTFRVVAGKLIVAPMATVIDVNSEKPLRSRPGATEYGGAMPKFGHGFDVVEQDLRNEVIIGARGGDINPRIFASIFFDKVDYLIQGVHNRINNMSDQLRSTGKIIINVDNNPDGTIVDFDFRVPAKNRKKVGFASAPGIVWTDPTADPIQDLIDLTRYADDNSIAYNEIEMSKQLWNRFVMNAKVIRFARARLKIADGVSYPITVNDIRTALEGYDLPPIVINDNKQRVERDGIPQELISGFKEENVVLHPSGNIGEVKNAVSVHTILPSTPDNLRSTAENGRIAILNQWDARKVINHLELELWAIPTLTNPNDLIILDTSEAV